MTEASLPLEDVASAEQRCRELVEKNTRLQVAYDRLRELDRLKSNFLGTVSHELRTPLTSIIGYSEMLVEGLAGELSSEQLDYVQTIHEKGNQLLSLIQGLLDLSKLESGTMKLRHTSTRIDPILRDVLRTVAPAARKKRVVVSLDSSEPLVDVHGDAERLRQVFVNLTDNALKFTPEGGTVTIRMRRIDGWGGEAVEGALQGPSAGSPVPAAGGVEVRVIDTGIGIPESERPRVFDAFYQVDSSSTREYGGTGLGLSIVKRLIEGHGGTIEIESNAPTGAVFVVTLPVDNARARSAVSSSQALGSRV